MERDRLNVLQLAALGLAGGTIVSIAIYLFVRLLHAPVGEQPDATPPIQPAISREMPAQMPDHFTENLIVPGFTETGAGIEEQDNRRGRSPEGV